jgi:hypothetical protein
MRCPLSRWERVLEIPNPPLRGIPHFFVPLRIRHVCYVLEQGQVPLEIHVPVEQCR